MTLKEEIALAIGHMGMSLETYLQLTPDQFSLAYREFTEAENERQEAFDLTIWRAARWAVWRTLRPPDKKSLSQIDLIELPGDKEIEAAIKKQKKASKNQKPVVQRDEGRFRAVTEKWKDK